MIARGTAGGREPVGLFFAIDMVVHLLVNGLHQRSGVALPTDGRADPAIGNEALAGTGCFSFFFDVALYCTYVPGTILWSAG